MATQEAVRSEVSLGELIDQRICPPGQVLDWESPALSTEELTLINHTHGLIGDFITGPDEVKIAIGISTLGQLESFDKATTGETDESSNDRPLLAGSSFAEAVMDRDRELREGLSTEVSNLRYAGRNDEIVPAILRHYSVDFDYPDGVIEDLSALEAARAINTQAVREGLSRALRSALEAHIDGLIAHKRIFQEPPVVSLELDGDEQEVRGRLLGLRRDMEDGTWLEVGDETGIDAARISHDRVRTIGIRATQPQSVQSPHQPGLLRRLTRL